MVPKFQSFFRISSFVFSRRKKLIQVCYNRFFNNLNDDDRIFIFGWSIPLRGVGKKV